MCLSLDKSHSDLFSVVLGPEATDEESVYSMCIKMRSIFTPPILQTYIKVRPTRRFVRRGREKLNLTVSPCLLTENASGGGENQMTS